jgi:Protein of unknown function (DUF3352)
MDFNVKDPLNQRKKLPLLLTLGASAALVAGGGVTYWLLTQSGGVGSLPTGANVIPQDALMVVSVSTEANKWQQLRAFGTPRSQAAFDQTLAQMLDRFVTAQKLDYQKDIQPWVGQEVTLAFLAPKINPAPADPSQPPVPPTAQPIVLVLPIADPLKAKSILEQPRELKGAKWSDRTYKEVAIKETQGTKEAPAEGAPTAPPQNYSVAALDGKLLVVTNDAMAMNRAIDTYKGGLAIAATPGYADALRQIQVNQPLARLYFNISASSNNGLQLPSAQTLTQLQQSQGVAATVALASEGVQVKSVSWLKPNSQRKFEVKNAAQKMPNNLPADTLLMASGGDLKRFWQDYTQGFTAKLLGLPDPDNLRKGLKASVGMELEADFLEWMQGEYTLAMVPAPAGTSPKFPVGLVFMVQASDRRAAEKSLKQLDDVMTRKYNFKVEEAKVEGQPTVNWSSADGVSITRGWLDGNIAFLTLGAPVASTFLPKPARNLSTNDLFGKTTSSGLNPNNGHFFMNVDRVLELKSFPLIQMLPTNRVMMEAMRSIGVTAAISSDRSARYDIFIALKKGQEPGALPTPNPTPESGIPLPPGLSTPTPTPTP